MEGDIVQMGAYIGAGLACTGMGGAAVGVGHVVGNFLSGALRMVQLQRGRVCPAACTAGLFFGTLGHFSTGLRPNYQNSRMSRNMCICRHKLCNAKMGVNPTFRWSNEA